MPADQVPQRFIEGFTSKVYCRYRQAEGSVRCSDGMDSSRDSNGP
jgi:hypothetical protein